MPVNKNAMTRYALIDRLLASRGHAYSIQDIPDILADRLADFGQKPVSKRCVEKDLVYLTSDSPFDVEIEEYWIDAADRNDRPYRKRCIRYADPTFSIFKPKLTDEEKTILGTALRILGSFDGLENFEWLNDLRKRLNIENQSTVISISKNLLVNSTLIARLFTSITSKRAITIDYHTFIDSGSHEANIIPHLLKEYNNRWFLIASAYDTGKILTFPLDRIDDFRENPRLKYKSKDIDLQERYEEIVGVSYNDDAPLEEIIFWVSDKSKDYILTKPIHESQITVRHDNDTEYRRKYQSLRGGQFFKIECRENYELIRELMSFGPELLVLSPSHLSKTIKTRINQMQNAYDFI